MEQGEGNRNLPKQKPKKNGVSELLELALDFHRKGTLAEARRLYDEILLKDPYHFEALHLSGVVALQVGKLEDAEKLFLSAIKVNSQIASIYLNYGVLLNDLKRLEEALASYDRAIALKPDYAEALNNRGVTLRDLKRFEEALASYDRAIALKPDYAEAYFNRSLLHLLNAKFELAWADYEWRKKKKEPLGNRLFSVPLLSSISDANDKSVLVHWEQGLGDTIQFCRYTSVLVESGARVFFAPQVNLKTLMSTLDHRIILVDLDSLPPSVDFHIPLMSLPGIFSTAIDNIPASIPYIKFDAARVDLWKSRIGSDDFKIGICWQGSLNKIDVGRSFPVSLFKDISHLPDVRLISLHKGEGENQLLDLPNGMQIQTLGENFDAGSQAFLDTAAVMKNLDLIITSDTAVAHLAGALGVPVWVALKYVPDWRWMLERTDSPWYPTMRLFRQKIDGDWIGVFKDIEIALKEIVRDLKVGVSKVENIGRDASNQLAISETAHKSIFNRIYSEDFWRGGSGPGSFVQNTAEYRNFF